ncbi:MarR family transcriptional regulator [Ilumatobacter sp.]|uniref:MarR family transcriptional regulator n=1 Tax=Ilumatobacter sp. TaxID=1967498 RepID=UPI003C535B6E
MTEHAPEHVEEHLSEFSTDGHVQFRENRGLWQLTPDGRIVHAEHLAADLEGLDLTSALSSTYATFIDLNTRFKELCGAWQLRDGEPNDHSDPAYDRDVVEQLSEMHSEAKPVVGEMGEAIERLGPYSRRLDIVLGRVQQGETKMFTGVMCGSYHDAWMELHEDLILTQGIDRSAEGSF